MLTASQFESKLCVILELPFLRNRLQMIGLQNSNMPWQNAMKIGVAD